MIKTISITAKCSDLCFAEALDEEGGSVMEGNGYVPNFMPEEHYGDYVILEIDVATGLIKNWKKPTQAAIKRDIEAM